MKKRNSKISKPKPTRVKKPVAELVARATDMKISELEKELSKLKRDRGIGRHEALKKRILAVTKREQKWTLESLSRRTAAPVVDLEEAVTELFGAGVDIQIQKGQVERHLSAPPGSVETHFTRLQKGGWLKFGVLGDNQLGNKKQRLDVANTAYDHFESEGIEVVYHTGNMIDGFSRFNQHELLGEAGIGIESQSAYARKYYPRRKGVTTYFITGECHEGWWAKANGINVGRTMESRFLLPLDCSEIGFDGEPVCKDAELGRCPTHGRDDLVYVGHLEADLALHAPHLKRGVKRPMARLIHPGGGTAYALSYKGQKLAESLQGGEKPQLQFIGHYHKFDYNYHREIHNILSGCLCDQTVFMRKHALPAHVGYIIMELFIGKDGVIERCRLEWNPFFDQAFYKRYETW